MTHSFINVFLEKGDIEDFEIAWDTLSLIFQPRIPTRNFLAMGLA